MAKHRRRTARARAVEAHCEVCGEVAKLHRMKVVLDGECVARWRLCVACCGTKWVAMYGKGVTGVGFGPLARQVRGGRLRRQ